GSTERSAALGDAAWRALLEQHHALVRRRLGEFDGEEVDTAGDGFFAVFYGPPGGGAWARPLLAGTRPPRPRVPARPPPPGRELMGDKPTGIAVPIGARVAAAALPGEVLVSSTVKDLVAGSEIAFEDRGTHELKGVGEWRLYAVAGS